MRVRWSQTADLNRDEIVHQIWMDNPQAARRFDSLFARAAERLGEFPYLGREGMIPGTREFIPHPNYRLVYEVTDSEIFVHTLLHARRQWPPELEDNT